jgi:hypothetical protein
MMHADASLRIAIRENMAIIGRISATSMKIGGAFRIEHQVLCNDS